MRLAVADVRRARRAGLHVQVRRYVSPPRARRVEQLEPFESDDIDWCDGCDLPAEACCCPEADEYDEDGLL